MELYERLEVIGSGAFGQVTKIRRKSDGRLLVWKELNYGTMNEREKQQIVAEVNIIRELRSPFIVRYYDRIVDKQHTKLYIVMEYCAGGDLGHVIKRCKRNRTNLEEAVIWKALAQLLLALKDCHTREDNGLCKPILHRDIKPANILLDQNKNIKLGDFGLAKELSSAGKLAQTHVGTPFYMSPELISGRAYDEKSDIWAIGCLLYELAALRPPFDANNQLELAVKIKAGKYHRIPSKYSSQLVDVIGACMQLDPSKRPRLSELESMMQLTQLQHAIGEARKITKEYELYQSYSDKWKEVRSKEDSLKALESELRQKENELVKREVAVLAREDALNQRERDLRSAHSSASASAESDMMDIEPCHSHETMVPNGRQPAFSIYCDTEARVVVARRGVGASSRDDESSKENIAASVTTDYANKRSSKIDNILARASALTQNRCPSAAPRNEGEGCGTLAKRLMADTPVLASYSSPTGNSEAIYIQNANDEGSASKRRRKSVARPPPPPPTRAQQKDAAMGVTSVHVDLRTLLPPKATNPGALRARHPNCAQPVYMRRAAPKQPSGGSLDLAPHDMVMHNDAEML